MKGEVERQLWDLHAEVATTETDPLGFGTMENPNALAVNERDIWLHHSDQEDLLGMNDDASIFYSDFPPLPDFPCISSSSSSSSTQAPTKTMIYTSSSSSSSSSSSAASWAVLKSDAEEDVEKSNSHYYINQHDAVDAPQATLSSTASMEISQPTDPSLNGVGISDCMDVSMMESFDQYMDLFGNNDFFDPESIFQNDEYPLEEFTQEPKPQQEEQQQHAVGVQHQPPPLLPQPQQEQEEGYTNTSNNWGEGGPDGEMSTVFLEWLKSNKDSVSANDLRSVKLKKSTIESAARRLGGGKEAMKKLLKLILEWVQTSHLQNKRPKNNTPSNVVIQFQENQNFNPSCPNLNPVSSFGPESNPCFNHSPWISPPPYGADPCAMVTAPPPFPQPMVGYIGDPYTNSASQNTGYVAASEYPMLEPAHSWSHSQFTVGSHYNQQPFGDNNFHLTGPPPPPLPYTDYGNPYPYPFFHGPGGERLMRFGTIATKEARKKRMERQRRYFSHHRHHNLIGQQNHHHQNQTTDASMGSDNCTTVVEAQSANQPNWMYWQGVGGGTSSVAPVMAAEPPAGQSAMDRTAMQTQNHHPGRVSLDRRQGWKPEKNLKFLLQKVLKQSDVGSLGRIVLPKKEAETHLPELDARDGIPIAMEDIGMSRVWNMRYRYWPNNKSRMYLLENTGDFVRANGLQEGDFIVLYSDVKCGKFMIRGVKVRQAAMKPETKKAGKSQRNQHGNDAANTACSGANRSTPSSSEQKN